MTPKKKLVLCAIVLALTCLAVGPAQAVTYLWCDPGYHIAETSWPDANGIWHTYYWCEPNAPSTCDMACQDGYANCAASVLGCNNDYVNCLDRCRVPFAY